MNLDFWTDEQVIDLAISIGILLLFVIFRRVFTKYIFALLLKLGDKAPTSFFSSVLEAFNKPFQWVLIIIGTYIAAVYFPFFDHSNPFFRKILRAILIGLFGWGLFNLSSSTSRVFSKISDKFSIEVDVIIIPFISRAVRFVIVAIIIAVILTEFGFDVNGFMAGLGLGGLAIALAAKDAVSNLFGGVIIITEKPFTIGDWILTPSVEGTVEDISFRSTLVRTFEQALVTVPNATLANESITNWSKMGKRQISFNLRFTHDTPVEKLRTVSKRVEALLKQHEGVHPETIFVRFNKFQDNGVELFLYFFTSTTVWAEYLEIREEINYAIKEIIEEENAELALPSRKLYVDSPEQIIEA
ncbi:mechanosensitive ion channel family protein [Chungangia koreensis]|uniref:Mechanosensitive ion channel family protein n=1 Tax=Chungangia koreensis TaxID=752657 RepID=A0ABV8X4L6_9LACT